MDMGTWLGRNGELPRVVQSNKAGRTWDIHTTAFLKLIIYWGDLLSFDPQRVLLDTSGTKNLQIIIILSKACSLPAQRKKMNTSNRASLFPIHKLLKKKLTGMMLQCY